MFCVLSCPKHHHITPVLYRSLYWLTVPQRIHYKIVSLTYNTLQTSQPSYIRQLVTIQPPRSTRSSLLGLSFSISASSLILSKVLQSIHRLYTAPALWDELPKELRQFAYPPNPPPNLTYPPFALCPATFHSRLKTELFSCPIPILLLRHDTFATTTGYNRSPTLSPGLDLPGF